MDCVFKTLTLPVLTPELAEHGRAHVRPGHGGPKDPPASQHTRPKSEEPAGNPRQPRPNLPRPAQL